MRNNDNKFYTPCFILEEEKVHYVNIQFHYVENDQKMLASHNNKIKQELVGD